MTTLNRELYGSANIHLALNGPSTQERIWLIDKDSVLIWDGIPELGDVLDNSSVGSAFRCVDINIEGFGKPVGIAPNYNYEYYKVTATYSTDSEFAPTIKWELSTETEAVGKGGIWDDGAFSLQDVNILIPTGEMTITRCVSEADFNLTVIADTLGHVNDGDTWNIGTAAGTLLFVGCEVEPTYIVGKKVGATALTVSRHFNVRYRFVSKNYRGRYNHQWVYREAVVDDTGTTTQQPGWHQLFLGVFGLHPMADFAALGIIFGGTP